MKLEREWRITTPEEAEKSDREFYRNLDPNERVRHMMELIDAWTPAAQRRLERTYRVVSVPLPGLPKEQSSSVPE